MMDKFKGIEYVWGVIIGTQSKFYVDKIRKKLWTYKINKTIKSGQ